MNGLSHFFEFFLLEILDHINSVLSTDEIQGKLEPYCPFRMFKLTIVVLLLLSGDLSIC